jgi:hypothetical protein
VEAAPTFNTTCSFWITTFFNTAPVGSRINLEIGYQKGGFMKIGIVGCGFVGSSGAFAIALEGKANEWRISQRSYRKIA